MTADEALKVVNTILEPKRLNYIQEVVFLQAWAGKIYREIAIEAGYDVDYIKEVGAQLWNAFSEILGERVTKKNVKLVLANYASKTHSRTTNQPLLLPTADPLRFPTGSIPLRSNLYIDRPPLEEQACAEISRPGSLIRIEAPRQMGKTSLTYRILSHGSEIGLIPIRLSLQRADRSTLANLNRFLRWFCLNVSQQLSLQPRLDDYWNDEVGHKVSCTLYFQDYVLRQFDTPIVLALDEVNRIFDSPNLAHDFLSLLRSWHEEAAESGIWQKLRLVVVHRTEVHIPLQENQSPFNVGLLLHPPEFTLEQTADLAQRHSLKDAGIAQLALESLHTLVGGHPYLVQLSFYWLQRRLVSLNQLLAEAPTQSGIYSDFLHRYGRLLQHYPELGVAFRQVVRSADGVELEATIAHRLKGMGLVKLNGNRAIPRCEIYRLYFGSQPEEAIVEAE